MIARFSKWKIPLVLFGLASAGVLWYVAQAARATEVGFPLDDAWIHQTYARNLAEHGEWAFVPGQPSSASTSPLYTLLLALGYIFRVPYFGWTFLLGIMSLGLAGWFGIRLGTFLFPRETGVGTLTGITLVMTWHLVWAAASGMETMLFSALVLGFVALAFDSDEVLSKAQDGNGLFRRGMLVGGAGAALTLARPEGALLVLLFVAGILFIRGGLQGKKQAVWQWGIGFALVGLAIVLPLMVANWRLTGSFLPDTAAAKQAEYRPIAEQWSLIERYGQMVLPLFAGSLVLLLPGIVYVVVSLGRQLRADVGKALRLIPLVWCVAHVSAYALRLPANYQHGRYVIPVLPVLIVYGLGGTFGLVRAGRNSLAGRVLGRSLILSVLLTTIGFWWIGARQYGDDVSIINTEMVATAKWVDQNVPEGHLLAVHDIGAIGYFAPRPILDLAGLVSPEVISVIGDGEALMRLMCVRDVRYLMVFPDQRPVPASDERLGGEPVFVTRAPYSPAAGGGNMAVYKLVWPEECAG